MITKEELRTLSKAAKINIPVKKEEEYISKINDVLAFCDTMRGAKCDEDFIGLNNMPETYRKLKAEQ